MPSAPAAAAPADPDFVDQVVNGAQSGWAFANPTAVEFAADGRVFVAEKSGIIKVFDSLGDPTPTQFADLRTSVHNYWDRGLLGMALHPNFPATPRVYVLYTYDAAIGAAAPRWGSPGGTGDPCPTPPGPTADGCVVSGRLSYLTASGNSSSGEQVLINDWCQQYPSHTIGDLRFGADGMLYVSGGDGASFNTTDWGQAGSPLNPCGDPPNGVGGTQTVPTAEGGALRSQDLRTPADPTTLDGAILRLNPDTGAAASGNPLIGAADPNARRIVAYGLRNPFRFTIRPGTNEVWAGDVGWSTWEEINRIVNPTAGVANFGWPCVEGGSGLHPGSYGSLNICQGVYDSGADSAPYFAYRHDQAVAGCPAGGGSSVSGLAFYAGASYPAEYVGSLFFSDYSRSCIWVMLRGANGLPNPANVQPFIVGAAHPVQLKTGPDGDIFYLDFDGGRLHRVVYEGGPPNAAPTADITANPTSGQVPLAVSFSGTGSSDPNGDPLTYAWDLDGDGAYDDSTAASPSRTYTSAGTIEVRLRVTDPGGLSDTDSVIISATEGPANQPPVPTIELPATSLKWSVGQAISFAGAATDPEDGALPASALSWTVVLQHCPSGCHAHPVESFEDVESGTFVAPDHEYPAHLELRLRATDSDGVSTTVTRVIEPRTVKLWFASSPGKLELTAGSTTQVTPFSRTVIVGSVNTIGAPSPQSLGSTDYVFTGWSDARPQVHAIVAPPTGATYTASFRKAAGGAVTTFISDLPFSQAKNGLGPVERDRSNGGKAAGDGKTLTLNGVTHGKGLGVHANSDVRVAIPPGCTRFRAVIGVDDEVGSKGSVTFAVYGDTTRLFGSGVMRGTHAGKAISLDVSRRSVLRLSVRYGGDSFTADHADWARARFICSRTTQVSDLPFMRASNGWGPVERDRSNGEKAAGDGGTLTLNGATYARGLGVHATSDVRVAVPPSCKRFRAVIGVDDETGSKGSVTFAVYGDTTRLFASSVMRGTHPGKSISIDVSGRSQLRLVVRNGGDNYSADHADWASARFICG